MIRTICPHCETKLKAPDEYAGKTPRCPKCRNRVGAARPAEQAAPPTAENKLLDELLAEVDKKQQAKASRRPTRPAAHPPVPGAAPVLARKPARSMVPTLITVAVSAVVILAAGAYMWKFLVTKRADAEARLLIDELAGRFSTLRDAMKLGDDSLKAQKYSEAKAAYEEARKVALDVAGRLQKALASVTIASARDKLQEAQSQNQGYISRIDAQLKSEELVNGLKGLVLFEGKWVTPEQRDELYRKEMIAQDKKWRDDVKKWMTDKEYFESKGMVFYRDQWMTKEQRETMQKDEAAARKKEDEAKQKLLEQEKARLEAAKRAAEARMRAVEEAKDARDKKYPPNAPQWVLDDFEEGALLWKSMTWANPGTAAVIEHKGSKRLQLSVERGLEEKAAIGRPMDLDLTTRDQISLDIVNISQGVVRVALAIESDDWYETREKDLRAGDNHIVFNLRAGDFKSKKTAWRNTTKAQNLDAVRNVYLLIYTKREGTFYIDNIVAERLP